MKFTGKIAECRLEDLDKKKSLVGTTEVTRIWVVAADKHSVRVFKRNGKVLELLGEAKREIAEAEAHKRVPGKAVSSCSSSIHHRYEPNLSLAEQEELVFGKSIAEWLEKAVEADAFDKLVLAAAPHTLGVLRKDLSKNVNSRIIKTMDKDLTRYDAPILKEHLEDILAI